MNYVCELLVFMNDDRCIFLSVCFDKNKGIMTGYQCILFLVRKKIITGIVITICTEIALHMDCTQFFFGKRDIENNNGY